MAKTVKRILSTIPKPREALVIPSLALRTVTSKNNRAVYASSDTLFKGAVFGRDSLEVAEDLMYAKPRLVHNILITLAGLQGLQDNDANEEESGKIVHEYRRTTVDGKPIDAVTRGIFNRLSAKWGGSDDELAYYGSVDATPHFLRTLHLYCRAHGTHILNTHVTRRDGSSVPLKQVAHDAALWILAKLDASASGLLEYHRKNPHGILNQVWKDSDEFYVHENGHAANHDRPIASIEVQGLAYDALLAAAALLPRDSEPYHDRAIQLRDRTIELLWQKDRSYFALGTDYTEPEGDLRIIRTMTANPAALLDTAFFDDLPDEQREQFISAITRKILGHEFLTDAGIRSRALSQAELIPFWDYHGSFVSWPKETYDIAKGLKRQGFPRLARQLENRLLNIVLKNREYMEFIYVDEHGRVLSSTPAGQSHGELFLVEGNNKPERIQAWTVSAIVSIITERRGQRLKRTKSSHQAPWQIALEHNLLMRIPKVDRHLNPFALSARYPTYKYQLANSNEQ